MQLVVRTFEREHGVARSSPVRVCICPSEATHSPEEAPEMSTTRRLALVLTLALATVIMTAAAALAQGGSPNPSGGTSSCRPGFEEGIGSIDLVSFLPRGFSIDLGAHS